MAGPSLDHQGIDLWETLVRRAGRGHDAAVGCVGYRGHRRSRLPAGGPRRAARAAATGKLVLCEKPLGLTAGQVGALLREVGSARLWEAFVFPFHPQTAALAELCRPDGPIGGVREIISEFHFRLPRAANLRWSAEHGGGALLDVGCYPLRLARLLFGTGTPCRH